MIDGQCNCTAVRYKVTTHVTDLYVCHCSICRRSTGSHGMVVAVVANEQFQWVSGQSMITYWKKPDADWEMWFCRQCGAPVPGRNDPSRMFIPAGSIVEGGDALRVKHHICVDSKAVWDEIGDDGQRHAETFEG